MAKNKKKFRNIKLEQTELTPTAIGMFENRRRSSIGIVLIFAVFIFAVVFMPQISDFVNNYFKPVTPTPVNPVTPNEPSDPDDSDEADTFTAYVDNLKITSSDISVSNIVVDKTGFTISYDVTNNLETNQNLEELNYYLEIFNTEQTFIERVKLADDFTLNSGAFRSYTKSLSSDAASTIGYISLVKKSVGDYPLIDLVTSEDGVSSLVCSKTNEKVTYKFSEAKLKELSSEVSYLTTDNNYLTIYQENKVKVNTYNGKLGVVSTMFEYESGYNITTTLNLNEASRMYLFNADSFKLDTEPKVVKFEMEAQGFKCE